MFVYVCEHHIMILFKVNVTMIMCHRQAGIFVNVSMQCFIYILICKYFDCKTRHCLDNAEITIFVTYYIAKSGFEQCSMNHTLNLSQ